MAPELLMGNFTNNRLLWIKATVFVLILLALGLFVWWAVPPELFDPDWIKTFLQGAGWWSPLAFILLRIVAIMVTVVPNAPLDIAGGALFDPFLGTIYSLLGSEAGAIVCFFLPAPSAEKRSPICCIGRSPFVTELLTGIWSSLSSLPASNRFFPLPSSATAPA